MSVVDRFKKRPLSAHQCFLFKILFREAVGCNKETLSKPVVAKHVRGPIQPVWLLSHLLWCFDVLLSPPPPSFCPGPLPPPALALKVLPLDIPHNWGSLLLRLLPAAELRSGLF